MEASQMAGYEMASTVSDRRGFLRAAAAVAAAGTGMLLSGSAHAAQPYARTGKTLEDPSPIFHLPVGLHLPCSMYASDVALNLSGPGALTLDFKGDIEVLVRESGPDRHVLEVTAFRAMADPKPSTPDVGSLFVLQLSSTASTPLSTLTPGLLRVHLPLKVTTIDKATGEETTLASTDPTKHLTLRSENVEEFPPRNQEWTQEAPVSLYQPGGSEAGGSRVTGTLEGFNPLVNQAI
ncbi:hypothetical protein ACFUJT_08375 [Streptomyces griseoincarnatus]